jgi:hypothetical protein
MARRDTIKIEARADYSTDFERIPAEAFDPEKHTRYDESAAEEPALESGETALSDVLSTRQANALAEVGLSTLEDALAYDGDLTELDGVGAGTVETLYEAADE